RPDLAQDAGKLASRHMKERRVGVNAVEESLRKIEAQEVLQPDLAAAERARHLDERRASIEAHGLMSSLPKRLEIASRPASEIENPRARLEAAEQGFDVLGNVMVAR